MMGEHRKKLICLMQEASGKHSLWNVFEDFCTMAALSLANQSDLYHTVTPKAVWEERENRYLETIRKYDEKERMLFPQMIAELVGEMEHVMQTGFRDVLGEIFHELEFHNKWKGQFFTPQSVCDMMGSMAMDADVIRKTAKVYGFVSLNEPACGSGAIMLGFANACRDAGINHSRQVLFIGQDVDERCIHMAYIQLSLYGFPAVLQQMDTLSMQAYGPPWYTPVYVLDGWGWKAWCRRKVEAEETELLEMING